MTPRGRAAVVGAVIAAAYLASAALSGHLSPLARRPLLDGGGVPVPYNWVSPPPALAGGNLKPSGARFVIKFDPSKGSRARVVSTTDIQASLILPTAALPPAAPATQAVVTITPLAPPKAPTLPPNLVITGNVYRIAGTYADGGGVTRLAKPATLSLLYPLAPDNLLHRFVLLHSRDSGRTWQKVPSSQDSPTQVQVTGTVLELGDYAVGQSVTGSKKPFPIGRLIYYLLIGGLVAFLLVRIFLNEARRRRKAAAKRT